MAHFISLNSDDQIVQIIPTNIDVYRRTGPWPPVRAATAASPPPAAPTASRTTSTGPLMKHFPHIQIKIFLVAGSLRCGSWAGAGMWGGAGRGPARVPGSPRAARTRSCSAPPTGRSPALSRTTSLGRGRNKTCVVELNCWPLADRSPTPAPASKRRRGMRRRETFGKSAQRSWKVTWRRNWGKEGRNLTTTVSTACSNTNQSLRNTDGKIEITQKCFCHQFLPTSPIKNYFFIR